MLNILSLLAAVPLFSIRLPHSAVVLFYSFHPRVVDHTRFFSILLDSSLVLGVVWL